MDAWRRLPTELVGHARAFQQGGRVPVRPHDAATTILLRDRPVLPPAREPGQVAAALEVYLLRRHAGMAFAAGMYAFPGGRVDPRDCDAALAWAGPTPATWAGRLGCDEPTARALVCAAVRETFEESGVLLAGPRHDAVVDDTTGDDWEADRKALVDRSLPFARLLERRGLVLRTDLLAAWAHWITPEFEPRRYDTRFFVALLPAGQRARDVSGEADQVCWLTPADALAAVAVETMAMLPPTYVTLQELARFDRAADAVAAAGHRQIAPLTPDVILHGEEGAFRLPGEQWPEERIV